MERSHGDDGEQMYDGEGDDKNAWERYELELGRGDASPRDAWWENELNEAWRRPGAEPHGWERADGDDRAEPSASGWWKMPEGY